MKTIYILLTRSNTVLSKMVHLVTKDTYTHASIAFDENLELLYSSSRKNGKTLFPAGPCTEKLNSGYYGSHSGIPCALYKLQVSEESYKRAKQEVEQIISCSKEYHFNIIGLILCKFNIPYHRKHYFFCSQFVGEVLKRSNSVKLPKDTSLIKPSDYMNMSELVCCFKGYINELTMEKGYSSELTIQEGQCLA